MGEVFIRAAAADRDAADAVAAAIGRRGLNVVQTAPAGERIGSDLRLRTERVRALVVVWSHAAAVPAWTHREIGQAIHAWTRGRLVLVRLDDMPLPCGLRDLPVTSLERGSDGRHLEAIAGRIAAGSGTLRTAAAAAAGRMRRLVSLRRHGRPHDVLVLYSPHDRNAVLRIVEEIARANSSLRIDHDEAGRLAAPVVAAIAASRSVALMSSKNAFASDRIVRQIYLAGSCHKPFITCQLDDTELPDDVWHFVAGYPRVAVEQAAPLIVRACGRWRD
ncbi:MAG: TIR domain-containing protein [Hyphomicrobiaceae bacterium]